MTDVTIGALRRLVHEFSSKRVWIEEQDHRWYIMHLDWPVKAKDEPVAEKWIVVDPTSLLFAELRGEHGVWRRLATRIRRRFRS
jgi:hypothetical protein